MSVHVYRVNYTCRARANSSFLARQHLWFGVLYLSVCEKENSVLFFYSCHLVDFLEVLMEGVIIVASSEFNLEALVRANVSSQSGQTLLACATYPHQ